jgi:hypothetical protein
MRHPSRSPSLPRWLFRKLTVRPVHFIESRYWYPIRRRATSLPPMACAPGAGTGTLLVLTTPGSGLDAVWSAWSHQRYFRGLKLVIACDGPVPPQLPRACARVLPGAEVVDARAVLERRPAGRLGAFASHHPFANKLRLILAFQQSDAVLYSDSDVLTLNEPIELLDHISARAARPAYMQGEARCEDPWVVARTAALGLRLNPHLNSGLLWIPRGSLDGRLAEMILGPWHPPAVNHFTEQNTLAALIEQCDGLGLPMDRYVANAQRMFYFEQDVDYGRLACRHFVNLVRYLMYSKGLPILWRQASGERPSRRLSLRAGDE